VTCCLVDLRPCDFPIALGWDVSTIIRAFCLAIIHEPPQWRKTSLCALISLHDAGGSTFMELKNGSIPAHLAPQSVRGFGSDAINHSPAFALSSLSSRNKKHWD